MQFETFKQSVKGIKPPEGTIVYLLAMWYDNHNNWLEAHNIVDGLGNATAWWFHAYFHRKQGDSWNADYWYRKAGKKRTDISLEQEWEIIVRSLL